MSLQDVTIYIRYYKHVIRCKSIFDACAAHEPESGLGHTSPTPCDCSISVTPLSYFPSQLNPASSADAGGDGSLDLGTLFAPLSRETIEMFLVRMISKHPEDVYWMIQAAKKPVDTLEIHNHVSTTVSTVRNTLNILRIISTTRQSFD